MLSITKKTSKYVFLFLLLFFCRLSALYAQTSEKWELSKSEEGIEIYVRRMETSGFRQVLAKMKTDAFPTTCLALIQDAEAATSWIDRMVKFELIDAENDSVWYTYGEIGIPWPFQNKDLISKNSVTSDSLGSHICVALESVPDYLPEEEGKARIKDSEGKWEFYEKEGKTEIAYTMYAEANDFLPNWLVEKIVVGSVFKTMENMKALLSEKNLSGK
ncbi:hypothetical protein R9C00_23410 [Flammeovirgaceae bacterium SG7u.111]|nr:hypothetical protein [Flammeovirgaceae bacterium SG7u.132]WPO34653.1 hypothetical protein R9C00_23410 [Flammeovirgaceae bacterium SG7u.111]